LLFSHCPCCFSCITLFMLCCYFCIVAPLSLVLLIDTYEPNSWCSFHVTITLLALLLLLFPSLL
jgi:hypothetical protein